MMFWVLAFLLTGITLYVLARPLMREESGTDGTDVADYDLEVYRAQLAELDRDLERGRIGSEEHRAARAEVARRMLAADKTRGAAGSSKASSGLWGAVSGVVLTGAVIASIAIYGEMGRPGTPDMPLVVRDAERILAQQNEAGAARGGSGQAQSEASSLEQAADRLRARLDDDPGDLEGWRLLGQTEAMLGNYAASAKAFGNAVEIAPDDPALLSSYGESLSMQAGGSVTDEAERQFRRALDIDPGDPRARYYMAEAALQSGDTETAMDAWIALYNDTPADAPWRGTVRQRALAAAAELGTDISDRFEDGGQTASGGGLGNPTQDDMAAAQQMSPEDRQAMIEGMVSNLAAKLADDPDNFEGWIRLIRSYSVLGEPEKAREALADARAQFSNAPFVLEQFNGLASELGLTDSGNNDTSEAEPPGPSEDEIAAAQQMNPEDRQAMIEGMVANLAARLEENPDDLEGWRRLARSYNVMGRWDKALDALENASRLAPEDTSLLLNRARMMRAMEGNRPTDASLALMSEVERLDPDNVEALWFLGLGAIRSGDRPSAEAYFQRALAALPEGSEEKRSLQDEVERLLSEG